MDFIDAPYECEECPEHVGIKANLVDWKLSFGAKPDAPVNLIILRVHAITDVFFH